jgi:hypothetical protein
LHIKEYLIGTIPDITGQKHSNGRIAYAFIALSLLGLLGLLSLGGTELHRSGHAQNHTVHGINNIVAEQNNSAAT